MCPAPKMVVAAKENISPDALSTAEWDFDMGARERFVTGREAGGYVSSTVGLPGRGPASQADFSGAPTFARRSRRHRLSTRAVRRLDNG